MSHLLSTIRRLIPAMAMLSLGLFPAGSPMRMLDQLRMALSRDSPSDADSEQMERGYYEHIIDAGRDLGAPAIGPARLGGPRRICEEVADLRQIVLRPNLATVLPDGATWTTNALGLRDRPYSIEKPPGTFRIAMVGDSIGVGLGVDDGLGFEPNLEESLNERARKSAGAAVEVLNFAVPGRSPGQRWLHFRTVGWATAPDLVLFESTQADVGWDERRLVELLPRGIGWDSSLYGDALARAGTWPGMPPETCKRALATRRWDLVAGAYKAVAAECSARGVPCIWMLIPRVGRRVGPADHRRLVDLARTAGFTAVVDVSDAFDGIDPAILEIRPNGYHPNAAGHALLARRLDGTLWRQPALRPLWGPGTSGVASAHQGGAQ